MQLFQLSVYYIWACHVAVVFLLLSFYQGIRNYNLLKKKNIHSKNFFTPWRIVFAGVLVGAFLIYLPLYLADMCAVEAEGSVTADLGFLNVLKAGCLALLQAIRMFAVDGEYEGAVEMMQNPLITVGKHGWVETAYLPTVAVLCVLAPLLTFSVVLSFFRNLFAIFLYRFCFWRPVHIFSELNERTIALASSIVSKKKGRIRRRPIIVFTDVLKRQEEESYDLIQSARQIGALCFDKDLASVHFRRIFNPVLRFYIIGEDEDENMRHMSDVQRNYDRPKTQVYIFSEKIQSTLILGVKKDLKMKVYRIYDKQSLIYQNLDRFGMRLFERSHRAYTFDGKKTFIATDTGRISVLLVGFGQYGVEMCKGLSWFCQLAGYHLTMEIFDIEENIEDKAKQLMPGFFTPDAEEDDIRLEMNFHGGTDVFGAEFENTLKQYPDTTYVFVSLGSDETNIGVSVEIRRVFESMRVAYLQELKRQYPTVDMKSVTKNLPDGLLCPDIETVVYDSNISRELGVTWPVPGVPETAEKALRMRAGQLLDKHYVSRRIRLCPLPRYRVVLTVDVGRFWERLVAKDSAPDMVKLRAHAYAEDLADCVSISYRPLWKRMPLPEEKTTEEPQAEYPYFTLKVEERETVVQLSLELFTRRYTGEDLWSVIVNKLPDAMAEVQDRYRRDELCDGVKNHKNQPYRIHMMGDLDHYYSYDTVINATLIQSGLSIHRRYDAVNYAFRKVLERVYDFVETDMSHKGAPEEHQIYLANFDDENTTIECYPYSEWDKLFVQPLSGKGEAATPQGRAVADFMGKNLDKEDKESKIILAIYYLDALNKNQMLTVELYDTKKNPITHLTPRQALAERLREFEKQENLVGGAGIRRRRGTRMLLDFERNEYSYFSSLAKALHERLRLKMLYADFLSKDGVIRETLLRDDRWEKKDLEILLKALGVRWSDRKAREILQVAKIEHIRWDAYMRSEGYVYGVVRNDLAKTHHNIVPLSALSDEDIRKDV